MCAENNDFRYLVFANGRYIDLKDGRFYGSTGLRLITKDTKGGLKLTPRELHMLKLMIEYRDKDINSSILGTALKSSQDKEEDNVYKRVSKMKSQLCDCFCDNNRDMIDSIIQVDSFVPKIRRYRFTLTGGVVLSNKSPISAIESGSEEDSAKVSERENIDNLADLASSDSKMGRLQDALDKRKRVYLWRKENLGEEHEETVRAMANLATSYNKLKMYDSALKLRQRVLEIREKTCDPASDLIRKAKKNLAVTLNSIGGSENLLKAEKLRSEIAEMLKQ